MTIREVSLSEALALGKLDAHDQARLVRGRELPVEALTEAAILRIEALATSGRRAEAERLAREFLKNNPGSPLVDRARSFALSEKSGPGNENQDPGRREP